MTQIPLENPSFEDGWHEQGTGILTLPDGWSIEYLEGADPWFRPETKPNTEFQTNGIYSVRAFPPTHSRGFFGIYQEVDVEPDALYLFSADVRIESNPPGEMAGFVGIQPWGASIFARHMLWGKETQVKREWARVEVLAPAFGSRVKVVLGATNKWATQNNTVWWDNARLELWTCEGGTEPEPPEPGEPCEVDYDRIAQIVRAELDLTIWASGTQ